MSRQEVHDRPLSFFYSIAGEQIHWVYVDTSGGGITLRYRPQYQITFPSTPPYSTPVEEFDGLRILERVSEAPEYQPLLHLKMGDFRRVIICLPSRDVILNGVAE